MTSATTQVPAEREPLLAGQAVVVIGGSAGIGYETARRAGAEGAEVTAVTGRNADRLQRAAAELGAARSAAFDATDSAALDRFFDDLPALVDHIMVTGPGPHYAPLADLDADSPTATSTRISGSLWRSPNAPPPRSGQAARCCS